MADMESISDVITTIGVFFEDPASPGTYGYACAMEGRTLTLTRERKQESVVLDCGPGAGSEVISEAGALDWSISGGATMEPETTDYLTDWIMQGGQRNVLIKRYKGAKKTLTVYDHFKGSAILTSYENAQGDAESITKASLQLSKGGPVTHGKGDSA